MRDGVTVASDVAPLIRATNYPRHCERSEAIHPSVREVTMDCFASLAMTMDIVTHSRDAFRPRLAIHLGPLKSEGAGTGCLLHPRSLACDLR